MILVAYATRYESTKEVAEAVAETLAAEGFDVQVDSAGDVEAIDGYDAIVLGVGLYMGRVHADARRFLRRFGRDLATKQVAVFGMGPQTLEPKDVRASRAQVERALARVPELEPIAVEIFGGVIDPTKFRFPLNRLPASDARDWDAIGEWARMCGEVLIGHGASADAALDSRARRSSHANTGGAR